MAPSPACGVCYCRDSSLRNVQDRAWSGHYWNRVHYQILPKANLYLFPYFHIHAVFIVFLKSISLAYLTTQISCGQTIIQRSKQNSHCFSFFSPVWWSNVPHKTQHLDPAISIQLIVFCWNFKTRQVAKNWKKQQKHIHKSQEQMYKVSGDPVDLLSSLASSSCAQCPRKPLR